MVPVSPACNNSYSIFPALFQAESSGAVHEAKCSVQKLQRRLNELKDELTREKSLRSSLEESHSSLLTRIQEMESVVDKEREEVGDML